MRFASAIVAICAAVNYGIGRASLDRLWSGLLAGVFACGIGWFARFSRTS
jgi:hypothetical protein